MALQLVGIGPLRSSQTHRRSIILRSGHEALWPFPPDAGSKPRLRHPLSDLCPVGLDVSIKRLPRNSRRLRWLGLSEQCFWLLKWSVRRVRLPRAAAAD